MGFFDKIKKIGIFNGFSELTEDFYEELEESLVMADLGAETTMEAVDELRARCKDQGIKDTEGARQCMREILAEYLDLGGAYVDMSRKPAVILFIGVNGVGKTTSIGKLAAHWKGVGRRVVLCAGDTFRAAAAEQLTIWAERAGVDIVKQHGGGPRRRGIRRADRRQGPPRGRGAGGHRRAAAKQGKPDERAE